MYSVFAVSMITGNVYFCRICLRIWNPSISGSIISRIARSIFVLLIQSSVKFEYFVLVILEIKLYYISDFLFVIYY